MDLKPGRIRRVLFSLGVLSMLGYGTAQAMAPIFETPEECQEFCLTARGTTGWNWNPANGACTCGCAFPTLCPARLSPPAPTAHRGADESPSSPLRRSPP
jgi:hypothetical protein